MGCWGLKASRDVKAFGFVEFRTRIEVGLRALSPDPFMLLDAQKG